MANRQGKDETGKVIRDMGEQYAIALNTEELYGKQAVLCHDAGLIRLTQPQYISCKGFAGIAQAKPTQKLLHSSDNTHGKMMVSIGTNLNHAPLKQSSKSSVEINSTILQFAMAQLLQEQLPGTKKVYATFLTLTYPNSNKGNLAEKADLNMKRVSLLLDQLTKGTSRKNGLRLVGGNYLGALVNREVTINEELYSKGSTVGIWNDHVHIILLSDTLINIDATKKVIFKRWKELNKDYKNLSSKAIKLEPIYDPKNPNGNYEDVVVKAIKEVVKYSTKPADINFLCKRKDNYGLEVFAELFNALKGKQMRRRHGLLWNAKNFLSKFDAFENAIRFTTVEEFPDIVTQLSNLVYNHDYKQLGRYEAIHERQLTSDEILYQNRSLIEKILVRDDDVNLIQDFIGKTASKLTTAMQSAYAEVFKSFVFATSLDDLMDKLNVFVSKAHADNKPLKAYDIELLANAITEKYDNGVLKVNLTEYKKLVTDMRLEFYDHYDKYVDAIKGPDATEQSKADWAIFAEKQGLSTGFIKDTLEIELYALSDYSENQLIDYLGTALFGSNVWESMKAEETEKEETKLFIENEKIIELASRNIERCSFAESYPIDKRVPQVKLRLPKIIIEVIGDFFEESRYVSEGYGLVALESSPAHYCETYVQPEIINPFL